MKKGFVLLLALVVSLVAFAAGSDYDGNYNGYVDGYAGYYSGDQNSSSSNDSVSRNTSVFNYLLASSVSYDLTMEVILSVSIPAGTAKVVIYRRYDWVSSGTTVWGAFKTILARYMAPNTKLFGGNQPSAIIEYLVEYGDAVEYRAAFYNFGGKLLGISNIERAVWQPII
ncbi:hypothetical protein KAU32_04975 [bacterium]|nr:hypothetical protein [bacterium]